jgi:hypothetical protein
VWGGYFEIPAGSGHLKNSKIKELPVLGENFRNQRTARCRYMVGFKEPLVLGISKASKSCQVS